MQHTTHILPFLTHTYLATAVIRNIIIFYTFAVILLSQGYYHQGLSTWTVKGFSNVYSTNINFPPCGQPVRAKTRGRMKYIVLS